jgi:hypothetical protein
MSDAYKCDRCGSFQEGTGATLRHKGDHHTEDEYEKELCDSCYVGWIEYITGEPASEINEWDAFRVEE